MKLRFLLILVILLGCVNVTPCMAQDDIVSVDISFTPPIPKYKQLEFGESYIYKVTVQNHELVLHIGDPMDPLIWDAEFTGNIIIDTKVSWHREGFSQIGDQIFHFSNELDSNRFSHTKALPETGQLSAVGFTYTVNKNYNTRGVEISDWLTFTIDVAVSLEGIKNDRLYVSPTIAETHETYYILTDEKTSYIDNLYTLLNTDKLLAQSRILQIENAVGASIGVNFNSFNTILTSMNSSLKLGNYVSAVDAYANYEPIWKDEIIDGLVQAIGDSSSAYLGVIANITSESFDTEIALNQTIQNQQNQISNMESTNRILSFAAVLMGLILAVVAFMIYKKRI